MSTLDIILILIGLAAFSFIIGCLLVLPLIRSDRHKGDHPEDDESDGGWGNEPNQQPKPSRWPGGGIPLPDAVQSSVRLRSAGRITKGPIRPSRTPAHPAQPVRRPIHTTHR